MRIAVMQPYIFPYLGYYQLVAAVDCFVFFDDVNYINKGWINRNQILQQNDALKFSIPLKKASQNRKINEIEIADYAKWRAEFLKLVEFNYKKAPFFPAVYQWLTDFLSGREFQLISDLTAGSVKAVAEMLQLPTKFLYSSELNYVSENGQNGEAKILNICSLLKADTYINPKNGVELYTEENFIKNNVALRFIHMSDISYPQLKPDKFVPFLSIIDVLMFNDQQRTRELLGQYLLKNASNETV
jgi:hypothetical protein